MLRTTWTFSRTSIRTTIWNPTTIEVATSVFFQIPNCPGRFGHCVESPRICVESLTLAYYRRQ